MCLCFLSVRERSEVSGITRSVVLKKNMECFLGKKKWAKKPSLQIFLQWSGKRDCVLSLIDIQVDLGDLLTPPLVPPPSGTTTEVLTS